MVADVSPAFNPSANAAAYFYLSSSVGTPLLSLISWVIFIMSKFFNDKQFFIQNWKYPSLFVTGLPSKANSLS